MVKKMLEIFNNALKCKDYYICLYQNYVYIYNYHEILSFNNDLIIVKLNNFNLKIKGSNLHINKMENHELLISGLVSGVSYE